MEDWTEKYRPKRLDDVLGNPKAVGKLREWAKSWESGRPKTRAVVLEGNAGVGKTSAAYALANDFGWQTVELNASDIRNEENILRVVLPAALNETFTTSGLFLRVGSGGRKLIILDEADSLYERPKGVSSGVDRGGKKAIIEAIKKTSQPIVLIVNDTYALTKGSGIELRGLCTFIRFTSIHASTIKRALAHICAAEGIKVVSEVLDEISQRASGDLRSAINDLQTVAAGKKYVDVGALSVLGWRDRKEIIFSIVRTVLKTSHFKNAADAVKNSDEAPEHLLLWIHENLPLEYLDVDDLVRGMDAISKADVYLGRSKRRQHYRMWAYALDMMSAGVALAKKHKAGGHERYHFPTWLKEMSASKGYRGLHTSAARKVAGYCHTSVQVAKEDILPYFKALFVLNSDFRANMVNLLEFDGDEIAFLLGESVEEHLVTRIMDEAKTLAEKKKRLNGYTRT